MNAYVDDGASSAFVLLFGWLPSVFVVAICFQSLLHDSLDNPQYAEIDADDVNAMDYIVPARQAFHCRKAYYHG